MKPPKIQSNREKALSVRQYILDNLGNPGLGDLQELSALFYITPKTLTREFQKQFHLTVREFINEERLKWALQLLQDGKLVREVATLIGYSYVESFGRSFKRKFGVTPGIVKKDSE